MEDFRKFVAYCFRLYFAPLVGAYKEVKAELQRERT